MQSAFSLGVVRYVSSRNYTYFEAGSYDDIQFNWVKVILHLPHWPHSGRARGISTDCEYGMG